MQLEIHQIHYKKRWRKNLFALAVLPLTCGLGACGKIDALVEAPSETVRYFYLNPPRPSPVIPPRVEIAPLPYWKEKKIPEGKLVCMQSDHYISMRVFNKEVSFWMTQANSALDYHEKQNVEPPKTPKQ